jgi:hypothetical protein
MYIEGQDIITKYHAHKAIFYISMTFDGHYNTC